MGGCSIDCWLYGAAATPAARWRSAMMSRHPGRSTTRPRSATRPPRPNVCGGPSDADRNGYEWLEVMRDSPGRNGGRGAGGDREGTAERHRTATSGPQGRVSRGSALVHLKMRHWPPSYPLARFVLRSDRLPLRRKGFVNGYVWGCPSRSRGLPDRSLTFSWPNPALFLGIATLGLRQAMYLPRR